MFVGHHATFSQHKIQQQQQLLSERTEQLNTHKVFQFSHGREKHLLNIGDALIVLLHGQMEKDQHKLLMMVVMQHSFAIKVTNTKKQELFQLMKQLIQLNLLKFFAFFVAFMKKIRHIGIMLLLNAKVFLKKQQLVFTDYTNSKRNTNFSSQQSTLTIPLLNPNSIIFMDAATLSLMVLTVLQML